MFKRPARSKDRPAFFYPTESSFGRTFPQPWPTF